MIAGSRTFGLNGLALRNGCAAKAVGVLAHGYDLKSAVQKADRKIKKLDLPGRGYVHRGKELQFADIVSREKIERMEQQRGLYAGEFTGRDRHSPVKAGENR